MKRQPHAHPDRSVTYMARRVVLQPRVWTGIEAVVLAAGMLVILFAVCVFLWPGPA